ncbi:DUF1049 domain-containing protein [Catenovulum sp. SM1970]|uniref:lipopolysaccharide assembly protein LapA domain-containing protein n=1 Tax=Marinifaba aquimaris TaxID=2741323 RepID=UPI00157375B7|nr:DUF1049 domain-containing protein [Marinifaba aquimaris]
MKKIIYFLVVVSFAVFALVLSSQNDQSITLNYILAKQDLILSQALAVFFIAGVILASLAWWVFLSRAKFKSIQQNKKIKQLIQENDYLRIQLKDQ